MLRKKAKILHSDIKSEINNQSFDLNITNFCKGIAILLMIIHHLAIDMPNTGIMIYGVSLFNRIGLLGKICVSIFLILSGFGCFEQSKNAKLDRAVFYKRKFKKTYSKYLLIVILSVIIGIVFFRIQLVKFLPINLVGIIKLLLTCSGIQYLIGYTGFNWSWWFVTAIIVYYLLFPFLKRLMEKYSYKVLIVSILISFTDIIEINERFTVFIILNYLCPFVIGMFMSYNNNIVKLKKSIMKNDYKKVVLLLILTLTIFIRENALNLSWLANKIDYTLSFLLILLVYIFWKDSKTIANKFFTYLGRKSGDIYYVHMFISTIYLRDFTYSLPSEILMVGYVLICSLLCSYVLNLIVNLFKEMSKALEGSKNMSD